MVGGGRIRHLGGMTTNAPLTRASDDKKLTGVAGGLARYFGVDPILFRVGFAVTALCSGAGLLAYLILALLMPSDAPATSAVA
jgi:phage shock protein C